MNDTVVFEESVDFKIGDVTLESYFGVTIPDYGIKIPECNTTGPIINPVYVPLRSIINFIELRGLHPQLEKPEDAEKIYYWIKAWNETASEINKKENLMLNPILSNTEEYFTKKLKFKLIEEETETAKEIQETNPFARNLLPKFKTPPISNTYNNENVRRKFNPNATGSKVINKHKHGIDTRDSTEHKMYEIFKDEEMMRREKERLMPSQNIPSEYEDIVFKS